jgi:hypothetical protein
MQLYWFSGSAQIRQDPKDFAEASPGRYRIGEWTYFEGTGLAPEGASGAALLLTDYGIFDLSGKQVGAGGDVRWDDIYLGVDDAPRL